MTGPFEVPRNAHRPVWLEDQSSWPPGPPRVVFLASKDQSRGAPAALPTPVKIIDAPFTRVWFSENHQ